jgi:hypothetical protein
MSWKCLSRNQKFQEPHRFFFCEPVWASRLKELEEILQKKLKDQSYWKQHDAHAGGESFADTGEACTNRSMVCSSMADDQQHSQQMSSLGEVFVEIKKLLADLNRAKDEKQSPVRFV